MRRSLALTAAVLLAGAATAQDYRPRETFAPFDMAQPPSRVRAADGMPGPDYWQNRADYTIRVALDPVAKTIAGEAEIRYTNNSPDTLDAIWLQIEQNLYRDGSRGRMAQGGVPRGFTDGMTLETVTVAVAGGTPVRVDPLVSDTRAELRLPQPLAAHGTAVVRIRYLYTVPAETFGGRTGWLTLKDGADIFSIAQWYPRVAVYDDIRGWDTAPYLAQEFYLDYGDFDYSVTAPSGMIVAGSGELLNPDEVLTAAERQHLAAARASDRTVTIRSASDVSAAARAQSTGTRTWHFAMKDTRDVSWAASRAFLWDAARINLPGGRSALAQSVDPSESQGRDRWGRSTEYLKDAVERFSAKWYPYPWPNAINVAGPAAGMEYPGIVFDGIEDKGKELFWITAHEIGHSWFPMIVGFDERRHAWMDEGFNTFIDTYESDEFNHGEYGPKRDSEFAPGGGNPVDEILPILADPNAPPILSRSDTVIEKYRHPVTYFKSALGLKLLREQILGPARFDPAFRRFIAEWAFKHPKPADFFRAMESGAGEDLSWWWRGWYQNNWQMDLAVAGIERDKTGAPLVRVEARDKLVMPATLRITYAGGKTRDIALPVETFIRQASTAIPLPSGTIVRAEIDPDHVLPDRDRGNNSVVAR